MTAPRNSRRVAAIVAIVVLAAVGSTALGLVLLRSTAEPAYDDSAATIRSWCANVEADPTDGDRHRSFTFTAVADAARAGRLERPTDDPPSADPEALDAWQAAHGEYLAASYYRLLEGYPDELAWPRAIFVAGIEEANEGKALTYPDDLRWAASTLDRYAKRRC